MKCDIHEDWEWDDWLIGRAVCNDCGHKWYLSPEQVARVDKLSAEAEAAFEAEMEKGRPCVRCGNDLDTMQGAHACGVSDEEWAKAADDGIPF